MIDIEKLAEERGITSGYYMLDSTRLRELCEAYAAKVLEDKERETAKLKELLKDRQTDLDYEFNRAEQNECEINALKEVISISADGFADKEREIAELKEQLKTKEPMRAVTKLIMEENDWQREKITELQAYIYQLREAAENYILEGESTLPALEKALSKTPAQSLQAFENEVIERCAQLSDACAYMSENFNALSEEIRALKVTND